MLWILIRSASLNICFRGEIRKILVLFGWKKVPYLELWRTIQIFFFFLHQIYVVSTHYKDRGASNEYTQHKFSWKNKKKYEYFLAE